MTKKRIAILISGRGSNMVALATAMRQPDFPAEPVLIVSNRPEAGGLGWAREAGIPTLVLDHTEYGNRVAFEARLHTALLDARVDLVCLAGFMRMLTGGFVDRWRDRLINIHPSLLPMLPGLNTHERALEEGVMITGCTVHFVRVEMDTGPIIAQAAVAVRSDDSAETLSARVLAAEHRLYPLALRLVASGQARVQDGRVKIAAVDWPTDPLIVPQS